MITDRNLPVGTRLVATYKGQRIAGVRTETGYQLTDVGEGLGVFDLDVEYKSPSAMGSRIMSGIACNGWRFWSVDGAEADHVAGDGKKVEAPKAKIAKLFKRTPNQNGVPEGSRRWFCNACMKSFVAEGTAEPVACPEGHRADDPELYGGETPIGVEMENAEA